MKNKFFSSLAVGLLLSLSFTGKAQCLNINGDFESFTAPPVSSPPAAGNAWINNDLTNWSVSHGSPTIFTNPGPEYEMWMWSYYGSGEGIFTDFAFVAGQTYELCYDIRRDATSNPASEFRVALTNGLVPQFTTGTTIAVPASQQPLTTQPWTGVGTWVTITETFTAGAAYSQLWLYPFLAGAPTPWQAACIVDNICIKPVAADPCDFDPKFEIDYGVDDCVIDFKNTTMVPAGFTILETTWDFGDGTTGTGNNVTHYYNASGGYVVCMTVWMINKDGECCKKEVCQDVSAEKCEPCEMIKNAKIGVSGTNPFTFTELNLPPGVFGYFWDFGDGNTGVGNPVNHTYASGGTYTVCLVVFYYDPIKRECCSYKVCIKVTAKDIAVVDADIPLDGRAPLEGDEAGQITPENIVLAPNPNNGEFVMSTRDGSAINTISIFDQSGKLVYSIKSVSGNRLNLDLKQLDKGIYLIIVNEEDEMNRQFSKVVIQ